MPGDDLLLSFYGDDFTGSTDAMESLARHGIKTVLFTDPPTPEQLREHPGLRAFGIAGLTRSLPPEEMERVLRPVFQSLATSGSPIVHYKVCSTFDSSPRVGSIGRVIDLGLEIFNPRILPILAAAPALGRYCVFGNHFARSGGESEPFRLDRHPSMSRHPVTPMDEADLRRHLAKQTNHPIALLDVLRLEMPAETISTELQKLIKESKVILIDALYERHLGAIGALLASFADAKDPQFVIGSSGIEAALCQHWRFPSIQFAPVKYAGPILVVCGSCSPVTAEQIKWAANHGFAEIARDVRQVTEANIAAAIEKAAACLGRQKSGVIHTSGKDTAVPGANSVIASTHSQRIVRDLLERDFHSSNAHRRWRYIESVGASAGNRLR